MERVDDGTAVAIDAIVAGHAAAIRGLIDRSGHDIVEIGYRLIAVKEQLPHGAFGPWLDAEFGWTDRTARRFMQVAEVFGENGHGVRFEAKALYALASDSIPEEVRDRFVAQADAGEMVRYRDVRDEIDAARADHASPPVVAVKLTDEAPPLLVVVDLETGEAVYDPEFDPPPPDVSDFPAAMPNLRDPAKEREREQQERRERRTKQFANDAAGLWSILLSAPELMAADWVDEVNPYRGVPAFAHLWTEDGLRGLARSLDRLADALGEQGGLFR